MAAPVDAGDAGASHDGGGDASMILDDAGRDLGPADAGHDAGPPDLGPPDLGRPDLAPPDLGPPDLGAMDLGPAPPNDTCTSAIDITGLGTFMGTTCGADDTITLGLGPPGCATPVTPGTPDVFYSYNATGGGTHNLRLVITPGYSIQFVPSVCSGNGGCGPYPSTMDFTIGGGGFWYFAIERSAGGCGAFSITVSTF